jgi:hypothetical protein
MKRCGWSARLTFAEAGGCDDPPMKLETARRTPLEQKRKAKKTRGLTAPDSEADFLCMGTAARWGNQAGHSKRIRFRENNRM